MKERIYTIRINEAFSEKCGCPLCSLYKYLEENEVDIITGASMMEPDIRIKTNEQGFCNKHYSDMLSGKNRLPIALILETHLSENVTRLFDSPPTSPKDAVKKNLPQLIKHSMSCYICSRINYNMNNILETIIYLYKTEPDFVALLKQQPYFCINHFRDILSFGAKKLDKKSFRDFSTELFTLEKEYLQKIYTDLHDFTKQFDYRADQSKNEQTKNAIENALEVICP